MKQDTVANMKLLHGHAKKAKTGSQIFCPGCGKQIIKAVYNKIFCSNQKYPAGRNVSCKDFYWNTLVPHRTVIFSSRRRRH